MPVLLHQKIKARLARSLSVATSSPHRLRPASVQLGSPISPQSQVKERSFITTRTGSAALSLDRGQSVPLDHVELGLGAEVVYESLLTSPLALIALSKPKSISM